MNCATAGVDREPSGVTEVIGAGPSGLAAAITFARAGRPVRVLERHHRVGQRFHGDMQGLENWSKPEDTLDRLARMGIDADFDHRPFHEVTFYDSRLRATVAHTQQPMFYLVRRGSGRGTLDSALLEQARSEGAEVRLGEHRRAATAPGTVVATGPEATHGLASGFTFRTSLPDQAHAIVHPELAPGGYSYLLIWDGRGTVATCMFGELHRWRAAREATVAALRRLVPGLYPARPRPFGGYAALFAPLRFTDPAGRWYVGEAAGLQDAEWGFGIMTALQSGFRAATCAMEEQDYERRARQEFSGPRAAGLANRALFEATPTRLLDVTLARGAARDDLVARMGRHWAPTPAKTVVGNHVEGRLRARTSWRDKSCQQASCSCLRCACAT